jgi:hypothetical protein
MTRSKRIVLAICLGLAAFLALIEIGEFTDRVAGATVGGHNVAWAITLLLLAGLFFVIQFILSRGADGWKKEWPVIAALNATATAAFVVAILLCMFKGIRPDASVLIMIPVIAAEMVGSCGGAWVALHKAGRGTSTQQ